MPSHSFKRRFQNAAALLPLLHELSFAWLTGSCTPGFGSEDVLRIELNSNSWASNNSLVSQRGVFIWVGNQQWHMDANSAPSSFPLLTVLSTSHNQTYIATSPKGAQDQLCPSSYTYNSNITDPDEDPFSGGCCTFNTSYTCHGYYDLATSSPIYFETSANFTGSPEDATTMADLQAANTKYGITNMQLVLPETYAISSSSNNTGTTVGHYGTGNQIFGFVDTHEEQVLGLGLNSTFLNALYAQGMIASRSIGLYYGVPAAAGADLERNGSMVMGGYSTSRLQGNLSLQTYPIGAWKLLRHCPWEIDISKLSLGLETSTTEFTACIEPSSPSLILPSSVYAQLSSSTSTNSSDLSITLSNGLTATIPSSLISMRPITDTDQSPILGAPFLSQFYIYADYQEKTLSVGLANNTQRITTADQLMCVEHSNSTGDLGWAVGSPSDLLASGTATATKTAGPTGTGKNGVGRLDGGLGMLGVGLIGVGVWVGL